MPDKKIKVTDPKLLAQLNDNSSSGSTSILQQVEESLSDLPSDKKGMLMAQVRHETGREDLQSNVAVQNNNVSGMTWNESFPEEWRGTKRPEKEGGYYVKFPEINDWAESYRDTLEKDKGFGSPLDANTIEEFAHRLKKNGYYTADEKEYLAGLKRMHNIGRQRVTDPSVLAQLNDQTPISQKKSPYGSEFGSVTSSSSPQSGLQSINQESPATQPQAPLVVDNNTIPDHIAAPQNQQPQGLTELDPITNLPKQQPFDEKQAIAQKTDDAVKFVSDDLLSRYDNLHQQDQYNLHAIPFHQEGSLVHDITNPHGNPALTGGSMQDGIALLQKEREQKINGDIYADPDKAFPSIPQAPATPQQRQAINEEYNNKVNELKDQYGHILNLQLFQGAVKDNKLPILSGENKEDAVTTAKNIRDAAIASANKRSQDKIKGEDKYDIDKNDKDRVDEINKANADYQKTVNNLYSTKNTKYDDVTLGIKKAIYMGDPHAEEDLKRYNAGQPLNPESKLNYQQQGQQIIKEGSLATVNENAAKQGQAHLKTADQVEAENQEVFNDRRAQAIGKAISDDRSWFAREFTPNKHITKSDVEDYGERLGLTPKQIAKIDPNNIPQDAPIARHFTKGALNSAAPIYEQGVRAIAGLAGVDQDKINNAFPAGWENQRGLGSAIMGNSLAGSYLDQGMEGLGALAVLPKEIGVVADAAKGIGLAKDVEAAHKLANFGVMAFNGYNNAYHESAEMIGDKPEDEWKRKLYSGVMGGVEGAIFSINPQANLMSRALGLSSKEGGLIGRDFLAEEIGAAKNAEVAKSPSFAKKVAKVIYEGAKDNGAQVTLAMSSDLAKGVINTMVNPKKQQNLPETLKQTAITTAITMALPSLLAGANHAAMQTPMVKDATFDIGANPEKYAADIATQLENKTITPEQAQHANQAIGTLKAIVDNVPTQTNTPTPRLLTPDEVKDYSWNMLREHTLQQQADKITEQATQSGISPDKARIDPINKQIGELQKEREDILGGKAPQRVPAPVPEPVKEEEPKPQEKPTEEKKVERSVATEPAIEKKAEEPKENLDNKKEKDITLQSKEEQHTSQLKKSEDESINNQEGRESNASTEESNGSEAHPILREAAHSNGRHEQEENRVLEPETKGNREPEVEAKEQPSAIPVKEKKAKKEKNRFASIEEKEPVKEEIPETKTEERATPQSEIQQQEEHKQGSEPEHAPIEPTRGEEQTAEPESSHSDIGSKAEEEIAPVKKEETPTEEVATPPVEEKKKPFKKKVKEPIPATEEKPTIEPSVERSVATEPEETPKADNQKSPITHAVEEVNKYIEAIKKKEAALKQLESEGKTKGDIDYDKKVAELENAKSKKNEAYKTYAKELKQSGRSNNHELSQAIRTKTEKLAKKLKEQEIQGVKSGGGGSTAETIRLIGNAVAKLVELGENIHMAIRKAIAEFKKTNDLKPDEEEEIRKAITEGEHVTAYRDNLKHEPPLLSSKEDYDLSVSLVKEIKAGNDTLEDVMDDLHEANISPERKKTIADFIDREISLTSEQHDQRDRQRQEDARESPHPLNEAKLKDGSLLSEYLGPKTTKDVFGEEGFADDASEKKVRVVLDNIMGDAHDMVNLYKTLDAPITEWGRRMMDDIRTTEDQFKKAAALSGLGIELQSERVRNDKELADIQKKLATNETDELKNKRGELLKEKAAIWKLLGEQQNAKKKLLSEASGILQHGRLDRLLRNEVMHEHYEKAILSDKERKDKAAMENSLHQSIIDDYKNHPQYKIDRQLEDEAKASQKRKEAESGEKKKETITEKAKKTARIIAKSIKGKKEYKAGKEAAEKDFGVNEKGEKMTAKDFLEHLKKLKNPC